MGKKQKKSGEDSAKDDGVDIDALAAEIEGAGASKEQKGKKKKKAAKREDFDEDDILKELEELSLEAQGGKAKKAETTEEVDAPEPPRPEKKKTRKGKKGGASPEDEEEEGHVDGDKNGEQKEKNKAPPAAPPSDSDDDDSSSRSRLKTKAGKKGGKRQSVSDEEEPKEAEPKREGGKEEESDDDEEVSSRRERKKKSKGKGAKVESDGEEEQEDEAGGFKIKTAAQKKAEKKERDKKKKEEERMKQKKMKEKEDTVEAKPEPEKKTTEAAAPPAAVEEQEGAEPAAEDENEGDKKKKDKKKKKGEKEEKKKGPSKATVKAMQEALAKMKEEEERARREEEERLKRLEELEKQRQEQERLEQERREKKKQKEKERKERLKKEGKLLTKAQREARARAEATLKLLQAQGVEVPSKDSVPKKKPIYGDKRKKKPSVQSPEETSEVTSPVSETPEPVTMETESEPPAAQPEAKADADLDDWEAMASDEEKERKRRRAAELKKVHIEVKEETPAPRQPAASEEEEEDEEDEEDDDEDEEEEEEESEEEAEAEKESAPVSHGKRRPVSEDESSESDDDDGRTKEERLYDRARKRIEKRRAENLKNTDPDRLRAPVVCVLGHVDTGKTKILDKLRHTHVQDGEAGGITQQIGATNVPKETIEEQTKMVKNFDRENIRIPGMLIIDTPGHESFSNLRNRGSSLCDIAILVVDIMHGLEPQTIESINLLKEKKCPFIVALNKIDRLYDWKKSPDTDVVATLKKQKKNTKDEFDERTKAIIVEFAQQSLNAALFFENKDPRTFVSLVPTSAHSGDGMGNLIALLVELTQSMLARRLAHCDELRAQVMEVKALPGMGTTIDVILINGRLREGETIIVPGVEGPIVTQIRGLLLPPPLKELRVKSQYEKHKEVSTSQGVKILGKDLEKTLAGLPLLVAHKDDEIPVLKDELVKELKQTLSSIKLEEKGVYVQASTLGSLEALLEFLRTSKVPYAGINIGPVHKKDVMKASTMLEHDPQYAVILAFDVKVERESQEMADSLGVRIFSAEIIYHLFDAFTKYREDYKKSKQEEFKHIAVFPVKLRVLPQFIFNSRDPIVMGVSVEAGLLKQGTPLCVPNKGFVEIGVVTSIEMNHKSVDTAKKGQEICVKIEPIPGESPKMYGRHFEATDIIVSKITRASIDALKNWFRDEMQKSDWQLIMELKKTFEII
ncbi:PREDICTED: eukaryotic translation initiation factor 5B isoform X1 [Poecilia mexicana]|uniref:Eukaryotic translation initiation factor 5B n=1 Tax=Poecilia mexicana TaxID=48701 RepID=A0A3B3WRD3_9TELE|nr:PREDICTED: eukaryotic translation initiation factor 5B isoform X1 [Poecilia mexicana]